MLVYLDNAVSSREQGVNENYARELMELHTLGVDGGYSQRDVEAVARCFSGWTIDHQDPSMPFVFAPDMHEAGDKTVLGVRIPSGGYSEGVAVINLLAEHPRTAQFIADKLARRFVSDAPPQSLVERVAQTYRGTDGSIRDMVHVILTSEEFFEPTHQRSKTKSPLEFVVSAVRAIGVEIRVPPNTRTFTGRVNGQTQMVAIITSNAGLSQIRMMQGVTQDTVAYVPLVEAMANMGQFSYQCDAPTGYPESGYSWLNFGTILSRIHFAVSLAENQFPGLLLDISRIQQTLPDSGGSADSWRDVLEILTGRLAYPSTPRQITSAKEASASESVRNLSLALGSPEFQYR